MSIATLKQKISNKITADRVKRKNTLSKLDKKAPYFWLSTWFGSGLILPASGTWGTVFSVPFAVAAYYFGGVPALLICAIALFFIGLWSSHQFEKLSGEHDHSMIVIDETVGYFIAAAAVNGSALSFFLAFLLFRFFDAVKPWPIGWIDKKVSGAFGVMIDDVVAGILSAFVLWGIHGYI
jgi:phosphatidylglycerophosphatase A